MRKLILLTLLFPTISFGQIVNSTEKSGGGNIYNDAIKRYLNYNTQSGNVMYDTLCLWHDILLSDSILLTKQKVPLVSLPLEEIHEKLTRETDFILHRLYPIQVKNGIFTVGFVPFIVRKAGGELTFSNPGSFYIDYMYDNSTKQFKYIRQRSSGF
jgi:hypothetical protein